MMNLGPSCCRSNRIWTTRFPFGQTCRRGGWSEARAADRHCPRNSVREFRGTCVKVLSNSQPALEREVRSCPSVAELAAPERNSQGAFGLLSRRLNNDVTSTCKFWLVCQYCEIDAYLRFVVFFLFWFYWPSESSLFFNFRSQGFR